MVPDLISVLLAVVVAATISTLVVLFVDRTYRAGVVDWWYGDREAWWEKKSRSNMSALSSSSCAVCDSTCTTRCGRCKAVKYCSKQCQLQHWKAGHKHQCKAAAPLSDRNNPRNSCSANAANREVSSKHEKGSRPEIPPAPRVVLHPYARFLDFFSDKSIFQRQVPVGLRNLGNTCFANSVLQCLLHTRGLASFLRSQTHAKHCIKANKHWFCLLCELEKLVCEYFDAPVQDSVAPRQLLSRLNKIAKHMVLGRQEDAHEFYVHLVDVMEAIMLVEAGGKEQYDQRTRETTFVHHLFGGYVRNHVLCDACGHESRTFESTMQLELAISAGTDSIEAALKSHFSDEILDGDNKYQCEKCKKKVRAIRGQRLEVAPNVLVICLKRFDSISYFCKNNKPVRYKEVLDVSPYLADDAMDPCTSCLYKLHGVVMHLDVMNSIGSGHYLSYVCPDGQQWYQCNDSLVRIAAREKALDPRAYMLFYSRQTPHAGPTPAAASDAKEYKGCNGLHPSTDDAPEVATSGPQSHPIPSSEGRHLSPCPCRTPSPTRPRCAGVSSNSFAREREGEESTMSDAQTEAARGDVTSRPLIAVISSSSDSADSDAASEENSGPLPFCIKGQLGQPGTVKVRLNLGKVECRAKDVQVAMSGTNHLVVRVPARPLMDLDMGDGVDIDKLESKLVKNCNHLVVRCTLTPSAMKHSPEQPGLPTISGKPMPESISRKQTPVSHSLQDHCPSVSISACPAPTSQPYCSPSSAQPHEPTAVGSSSTVVDIFFSDEQEEVGHGGGNNGSGGERVGATPATDGWDDNAAPINDCWSWPASVGDECESVDFGRAQQPACNEKGMSTSGSFRTLGAHPLSSAPASESPSNQPTTLEDSPTNTVESSTVVGKKRRKKHGFSTDNSSCETNTAGQDADGTLTSAPSILHAQTPAQTTKTADSRSNHQVFIAPSTSHATAQALVASGTNQVAPPDVDRLSVESDSDTSQEKSSESSAEGAVEGTVTNVDAGEGAGEDGKQKGKKGKGKKGGKAKTKKKKARKH